MSFHDRPSPEDLDARLADAVTEGVSPAQEVDLRAHADPRDWEQYELAAAAAQLALCADQVDAELPHPLRARLLADADAFFAPPTPRITPVPDASPAKDSRRRSTPAWVAAAGWLTAAAAVVFAAIISTERPGQPLPPRTVAEQLAAFRSDAPDVVTAPWSGLEPEFADVTGEVVWSDTRQQGYLVLRGLPANDPRQSQYQLWIVDPLRDSKPVDGGVFDVPANTGEAIIPVAAKLPVQRPQVFAITRERPGGVVVSEGPLLVVAKPDTRT